MPTTDNSDPSAIRVTRSLRKRLTSIDSDASSRPGTPVNNNLLPIPETVTPAKRVTRRNSVSTPSKNTPSNAKSRESLDFTPAKRLTRRQSITIKEQEENLLISKQPLIEEVKEEVIDSPTNKVPKRVTRSSSKSPMTEETNSNSNKSKGKPSKLSTTKDKDATNSKESKQSPTKSVEVKIAKNIEQFIKSSSKTLFTTDNNDSTPVKSTKSILSPKNIEDVTGDVSSPRKTDSPKKDKILQSSESSPANMVQNFIKDSANEIDSTDKSESNKNRMSVIEIDSTLDTFSVDSPEKNNSKLNSPSLKLSSPCLNREQQNLSIQSKLSSSNTTQKNRPEQLKNVAFHETTVEDTAKSVFPKTPGLTKSKSYLLDSSKDIDKNSLSKYSNEKEQSIIETELKSEKEDSDHEDHGALNTKTPYKLKMKAVESSTPIQNVVSPKINKSSDNVKEAKNTTIESKKEDEIEFPKTWSHSVSGTAVGSSKIDSISLEKTGTVNEKSKTDSIALEKSNTSTEKSKIDSIGKEKSFQNKNNDDENQDNKSSDSSKNTKSKINVNEDSDYEYILQEEDEIENLSDNDEEDEREKTIYVDDEAMEVPDGEESMDSEERAYLEENEIPTYGESIGSQDSIDELCEEEEEADEEDDAFIVSDGEELNDVDHVDELEKLEEKIEKMSKKFKRIRQCSVSSGEDQEVKQDNGDIGNTNNKNSTDDINIKQAETFDNEEDSKKELKNKKIQNKSQSIHEIEEKGEFIAKESNSSLNKSNIKSLKSPRRSKVDNSKENEQEKDYQIQNSSNDYSNTSKNKSKIEDDQDVESSNLKVTGENETTKSPRRKSVSTTNENELNADFEKTSFTDGNPRNSLNNSRKTKKMSLIRTSTEEGSENDNQIPLQTQESTKGSTKSPRRSSNKFEQHSAEDPMQNESSNPKTSPINESPRINSDIEIIKESRKSNQRKSISVEEVQTIDSSLKEKTRVSLNDSKKSSRESEDEQRLKSPKRTNEKITPRKSVASEDEQAFNFEDKKNSRKSLNDSKSTKRLSLHRNSSNENDDSKTQNEAKDTPTKSRKSNQSKIVEDEVNLSHRNSSKKNLTETPSEGDSEQEKTLSASETSFSKRGKKSNLSKTNLSLEENEDNSKHCKQDQAFNLKVDSDSEESTSNNSNSRNEDDQDGEGEEEARFSEQEDGEEIHFSDDEEEEDDVDLVKVAAESTIKGFLGEESDDEKQTAQKRNSSRRKSVNKSKLDETFEMDPKESSIHNNLQRSIFKKSLNQSKLQHQLLKESENESNDSIKQNKSNLEAIKQNENDSENESNDSDSNSSIEIQTNVEKRTLTDRGLSVSLSSIQTKKKISSSEKAIRNSFTIGVSVRSASPINKNSSSSDSDESENEKVLSEEEDLQKISQVQYVGPYKPRNSLSSKVATENKKQKKSKRASLCMHSEEPSSSFLETIEKNKKLKRKSNSFCVSETASIQEEMQIKEPKSERKQKKNSESNEKSDISHILSRCDLIMEAANEAKREAKLNAKKSKVKKPKWMDKEEKTEKAVDDEVKIPLVSKKEIKKKEKIQKEMAKALKHSTALLSSVPQGLNKKPKKHEDTESVTNELSASSGKRLQSDFLEALEKETKQKTKKKSKSVETTPPSDKENSKKHKSNTFNYTISDVSPERKKKKHTIETIETASGIVVVEPSTPVKLKYQNGFRESPKTPAGFKIQNINSAGKTIRNRIKSARRLITPSGEFIEEDLSVPKVVEKNEKETKNDKRRKRKLPHIEEPVYCLQKTQWTPSGLFIEEDLYSSARPLANNSSTQFVVKSLSAGKKKKLSEVTSIASLHSALNFKQNATFNNHNNRDISREILFRKQRKATNSKF